MDTFAPIPATRAEDLYAELHAQLVLERLGQRDLTDALGPTAPSLVGADMPDAKPTPVDAP